jgi:hypothetical protein
MACGRGPCDLNLPDWFWSLIDQLRERPRSARKTIGALTEQQMVHFYHAYREATEELCYDGYDEERWEHEDDYYNACCWVVSQGRDTYLAAWDDSSLVPTIAPTNPGDWTGLVAEMCQSQYGRELYG